VNEAAKIRKLPTGVPGLDIITHGGIPEGRSVLVTGRSGTGKTILALQIAANLSRQGVKTILLAVEESPDDLILTGDGLGMDLSGAIKAGSLRLSDASRPMEGPMVVSGEYDISGLIHRVRAIVKQTGARAVVLDSATALFSPRPPQELLRSLFFQLIHAFRTMELTSVVVAEAAEDYGQLTTLGVEDFVCDMVIIQRNVVDGERRRRSLEVNKYRRSAHHKGEFPCTITSRGLTIFPLDARERPEDSEVRRYSSGLHGLDSMIGGGLVRDSIVIVRGPTGSGKTMLAGLYARAGAQRGERVVYYGFEEPRPILLRNFAQIGMSMDEFVNNGTLQVLCRYPEAMGLEDLLVSLRTGLEESQPSLIVLDSISSIEHSSSEKGFRQFMIGLAALLREHGRSALLTQTVAGADVVEHTAPYLSTIADAILALDYKVDAEDLQRSLRVLKMRGSAHVTKPYHLAIEQGGLRVEPPAITRRFDEWGTSPRKPWGTRAGAPLGGLVVLLVEDFTDARETTAAALTAGGAEVVEAGSAQEAMAVLETRTPDVILCDIGMPDEDGYDLMRRIRSRPGKVGQIPAAALTAWTEPEDREKAFASGFQIHLHKPIQPDVLVEAAAHLAGRQSQGSTTPADRRR
jgi:circadian clock protein KaiC